MISVRTKVRKLGNMTNNANPNKMEINYGLRMTSVLIFCKQKGHFI